MANKIILHQRYSDNYTLIFIFGMLVLTLTKIVQVLISGLTFSFEVIALLSIVALMVLTIYFLTKSTLKVKIGKKRFSVRVMPLGFPKMSFKKSSISKVEFKETSEVKKISGGLVHFGNSDRLYNFGGTKAMIITLNDGKQISFLSDELYQEKEEILKSIFV